MSSSSGRRRLHVRRHPVVVDIGCSCRRPKLISSLFNNFSLISRSGKSGSKNMSSSTAIFDPFSPSTSLTTTITNSSFSLSNNDTSSSSPSYVISPRKKKKTKKKKKKVEESVAVEKVSSDPYLDFKDSMLQMIVEKEIYQWEELKELLHLFLSLNSPYHHHLIIRAFTEIWNGIFSPPEINTN